MWCYEIDWYSPCCDKTLVVTMQLYHCNKLWNDHDTAVQFKNICSAFIRGVYNCLKILRAPIDLKARHLILIDWLILGCSTLAVGNKNKAHYCKNTTLLIGHIKEVMGGMSEERQKKKKKQSECCVCDKSEVYLNATHKTDLLFFSTLGEPCFTFLHIMFGELHHSSRRHARAKINTASPFIWGIFFSPHPIMPVSL